MGDAPRHVAPGGVALSGDQTRDVVESQDHLAALPAFDAHAKAPRLSRTADVDVLFDMGFGTAHKVAELRRKRRQVVPQHLVLGDVQQLDGAIVDRRHPPPAVQADDARADAGQNRLDEAAAILRLFAGGAQGRLLRLKVASHAVEGVGQGRDLRGRTIHLYPRGKVAAGHLARRLHQATYGRRDAAGGRHPHPDRPDQDQQRRLQIAEHEGRLDAGPAFARFSIGLNGGTGGVHPRDQTVLQRTHEIKVGVAVRRQRDQGSDGVGMLGHVRGRLSALRRIFQIGARRQQKRRRAGLLSASQHLALSVQNVEGRITEDVADLGQCVIETNPVSKQPPRAGQLIGDDHQVRVHRARHVLDVGASDDGSVFDGGLDVVAEPLVDAAVDEDTEHQSDQDGGNHRHHRKKGHEAQMQPRSGLVGAPRQRQDASPDHERKSGDERQVGH